MTKPKTYKASALRLIDAAERLIGEHGFDRVSLQRIAAEAGQANKFAVQYHFGSKQGLVKAIFAIRLKEINARRRDLLDRMKAKGEPSIRDLIWAFFGPGLEVVDERGEHAYMRFAAQILRIPAERPAWFDSEHRETGWEVWEMLKRRTPHLSQAEFDTRLSLLVDLFTGAVRLIDNPRDFSLSPEMQSLSAKAVIDQTIAMCAAALACPLDAAETDKVRAPRSPAARPGPVPGLAPAGPGRS